jgi:hypothetical protein
MTKGGLGVCVVALAGRALETECAGGGEQEARITIVAVMTPISKQIELITLLAERVVEIDEAEQVMRMRPPTPLHG